MGFTRFYNQFTKSLDRRFNTDLRLSPSQISNDVQLIADIEKPLEVPFCIPKGYVDLAAPIRPTAFDLTDFEAIIERYNLQEAVTQFDSVFIRIDDLYGCIVQETSTAFSLNSCGLLIDLPGYISPAPIVPPFVDQYFDNVRNSDFTFPAGTNTNPKGFRLMKGFQLPVKMLSTDTGRVGEPYLIWDNFQVKVRMFVSVADVYNAELITMGSLVFQGNRTRSQ